MSPLGLGTLVVGYGFDHLDCFTYGNPYMIGRSVVGRGVAHCAFLHSSTSCVCRSVEFEGGRNQGPRGWGGDGGAAAAPGDRLASVVTTTP
jgi:hypothetical protein